jgi:VanZ family protein
MYISRGSAFSRVSLLAYLLAIVYASCYPFSGWRDISGPPYAYLFAPFSRFWTWFDVTTNILGYIPLGLLVVFALYPEIKGKWASVIAISVGLLLSATMESVQAYLPSRVPSSLDLLTNLFGTCIGSYIGLLLVPTFLDQGRFHRLGRRWFRPEASGILIVLALWPFAQIYPQSFLFGHGQIVSVLSNWLTNLTGEPFELAETLRQTVHLSIDQAWQFWLSETIITACGLTGTMLTLMSLLRKSAPGLRLSALLLLSALLVKSLAISLFFGPEHGFVWLTPGAFGGLIIGIMMVSGLGFTPVLVQRRMAIFSLFFCFAIVNLVPANYYFVSTLSSWSHGKFLNFNGAAHMLALCWPVLALCFLLFSPRRAENEE